MLAASKIDHPDRSEASEGHHADHNTEDVGPDQRGEDEGRRAARTPCTDRATVATQLTDLETGERVLMRVSKMPPARASSPVSRK